MDLLDRVGLAEEEARRPERSDRSCPRASSSVPVRRRGRWSRRGQPPDRHDRDVVDRRGWLLERAHRVGERGDQVLRGSSQATSIVSSRRHSSNRSPAGVRIGDPVGVEQRQVARLEVDRDLGDIESVEPADQGTRALEPGRWRPVGAEDQRRFVARVREAQVAGPEVEPPRERGDEQRRAPLLDQDLVRALERLGGSRSYGRSRRGGAAGRTPSAGPRRCPSRHVRDHHAQRAAATAKPEEVEEIAADLACGLVMGSDVVARHVRRPERHETALESPAVGQLLLDPPGVRGVLGRDRQVGHGRRRERGRERFGHGRPEAAAGRRAPRGSGHRRARRPGSRASRRRRPVAQAGARGVPSAPRSRGTGQDRGRGTTASRSSSGAASVVIAVCGTSSGRGAGGVDGRRSVAWTMNMRSSPVRVRTRSTAGCRPANRTSVCWSPPMLWVPPSRPPDPAVPPRA